MILSLIIRFSEVKLLGRLLHVPGLSTVDNIRLTKRKMGLSLWEELSTGIIPMGLGEYSSTIPLGYCCVQYPHRDRKPFSSAVLQQWQQEQ